jgi:hypothetical protein
LNRGAAVVKKKESFLKNYRNYNAKDGPKARRWAQEELPADRF